MILRIFMIMVCVLSAAGWAVAQTHPSQQPELTLDTVFPRCSAKQLASGGFPDHLHSYWWSGWETKIGPDGQPYGPGAFCNRKTPIPQQGLVIGEAEKCFGNFVVRHNPGYAPCDMLPLLELLTWAGRMGEDLLGLTTTDTLVVTSPDNIPDYREQTGQDVWRLYALEGDYCIIEPYGTLQARTLDGHAGFLLVTDWLLQENFGKTLPPWLHRGLAEYIADDGVHLVNYMVQFRYEGDVLLSPPMINVLLSRGVDPDPGRDREMYRRACYGAFLMVWRLVEEEGGLQAMRRFLELAKDGTNLDDAASEVYGSSLNDLALRLDPVKLGEPIGDATQSRQPHKQP